MTAVVLLVVVGPALAVLARMDGDEGRHPHHRRLFLRALGTGLITGGMTGGLVGVSIVLFPGHIVSDPFALALAAGAAVYGAVAGVVVALVPSVFGALTVTRVIATLHPLPATAGEVERELERIFKVVVVLLDAIVLAVVFAARPGFGDLVAALPILVAGNACVVAILCRSRRPLARTWARG